MNKSCPNFPTKVYRAHAVIISYPASPSRNKKKVY